MMMRQILRSRFLFIPTVKSIARVTTLAALLVVTARSIAPAALVCSKTVRNCGCSINSAGVYTVAQDLSFAAGGGDCLSINAKNVVLNLNGHNITGPGKSSNAAGVHVRKVATVTVEGQGTASQHAILSGWYYGIENDGNAVLIQNVDVTGNNAAGVFFFKAGNSELVNFNASNNSGYGVWLRAGSNIQIGSGTTSANQSDGVFLGCVGNGKGGCLGGGGKANSNYVYGVTTTNNGGGGITVQFNSDFNQIGTCTASGNTGSDLIDRNPGANNCAHDLWYANTAGSVNKSCIQ